MTQLEKLHGILKRVKSRDEFSVVFGEFCLGCKVRSTNGCAECLRTVMKIEKVNVVGSGLSEI